MKPSLFSDAMRAYLKISRALMTKLIETIKAFSKIAEHKINVQKWSAFICKINC